MKSAQISRERKITRERKEREKDMACSMNIPFLAKPTSPQSSSSSATKSFSNLTTSPLSSSSSSHSSRVSLYSYVTLSHHRHSSISGLRKQSPVFSIVVTAKTKPEQVMIYGAPASGKGTQCELITKKYGLVHIAAGDLLRVEVAAGSENGKQAKEFMEKGQLVPNEIVVRMGKERLLRQDSQENGWLLDGYPRSSSQAMALEDFGIRPDLFILLDVPEEILVERVGGRRLDPVTGKIYHLKYALPETDEIATRLTQRFDDSEEKVKLRLRTYHQNMEAVLSVYEDITIKVKGDGPMEEVFAQIGNALSGLLEQKKDTSASVATGN